jgi:hypothetical protein
MVADDIITSKCNVLWWLTDIIPEGNAAEQFWNCLQQWRTSAEEEKEEQAQPSSPKMAVNPAAVMPVGGVPAAASCPTLTCPGT